MGTTEMDEVDMVERWEAKKRDLEEAQLRRTFDGVDEDGSGEIEPPEFKRLCRRLDLVGLELGQVGPLSSGQSLL